MLVACARRYGLVASVTRIVSFDPLGSDERDAYERLLHVEQAFLDASRAGARLGDVVAAGTAAYGAHGFDPHEWHRHHQGGFSGFQPREFPASPASDELVDGRRRPRLEPERGRLEGRGHHPRRGRRSGDPGPRRRLADHEGRRPAPAGRPRPMTSPNSPDHQSDSPRSTLVTTIASHLVDGTWEDGDNTVDVTNPADGSVVGRLAWGDAKTAQRAADAAARAFADWADLPPRRRADILLEASRLIAERADAIGDTAGPRGRQAPPRGRRRADLQRGVLPLVRRAGPPATGRGHGPRGRRPPAPVHPAPGRRGGLADAVELPLLDPGPQARARPRRGVHRRRPGLREGPAGGDRDGARPGGRRRPGRRRQPRARAGPRGHPDPARPRGGPRRHLHRLHPGRTRDHGQRRPAGGPAAARARRRRRLHRLRRRRHRGGRRGRDAGEVPQHRAVLHRGEPVRRPRGRLRRVRRAPSSHGSTR